MMVNVRGEDGGLEELAADGGLQEVVVGEVVGAVVALVGEAGIQMYQRRMTSPGCP